MTDIDWSNYGAAQLAPTAFGTWRTRRPTDPDVWTASGFYCRAGSTQHFEPPFRWGGLIKVRSQGAPPPGEPARGITFHVMHGIEGHYHGNEANLVVGIGSDPIKYPYVNLSAEILNRYGYRTGHVARERVAQFDPADGRWHDFECRIESYAEWSVWWDGRQIARVVEKEPATMFGNVGVGLRLDGWDVEIQNVKAWSPVTQIVPAVTYTSASISVCEICSCLVADEATHTEWHS